MKKSIKYASMLAVVVSFTACQKDAFVESEGQSHPMTVEILCSDQDVKTEISFDGQKYVPSWKTDDKLGVYTITGGIETNTNKKFSLVSVSGSKASSFSGTIDNVGSGDYLFYGYYPYTSGQTAASYKNVSMVLPSQQNPTLTSFDGAADVLVAKAISKYIGSEQESVNDLNFQFSRLVSVVNVKLSDIDKSVENDKVKSVTISTPDYILSGSFSLDLETYTTSSWSGNNYAQANYDGTTAVKDFSSWINVNPVIVASGHKLNVEVVTENNIFKKEITLGKELNFKAGKLIYIKVNMAGCQINPSVTSVNGVKTLGVQLAQDTFGFNVISDGGFENFPEKDCNYWRNHTLWYIPSYAWPYDDQGMRSGKRSLFADLNTHDWRDVAIQTIALKKNTTYVFSIDMQKAWRDAGVFFGFRASQTHDISTADTETADWKTYTYTWANINDTQSNMFVGAWPWDNFWVRLDNLKVIPQGYSRTSYVPSSSQASSVSNKTFTTIDGCLKMVVWPIGNSATSTSYGVALFHVTIGGKVVETVYAHATATSDGLNIDCIYGNGKEMLTTKAGKYNVPTGGLSSADGNTQYVFYYSSDDDVVFDNNWMAKGRYVAKSTDGGNTWSNVSTLSGASSSKFVNATPLVVGTDVYVYGTPAGRTGVATYVAKVPVSLIEDPNAWRYFDGAGFNATTEDGAISIFYGPTSEMTVCFDGDTQNYVAFYRSSTTGKLVYRESQYPEGIWSGEKEAVADPEGCWYYAPSIINYPTETDGNKKIFMISTQVVNGYQLGGNI